MSLLSCSFVQCPNSMMSLFNCINEAPRDPILGLNELFHADPNPAKINLGVGVYFTDEGKIPLLRSVAIAEKQMLESAKPRAYLPIQGTDKYCHAVQNLLFGDDSDALQKIVTVQTLGGTGGLKVGADFLKRFYPDATVAISDPSWENHRALFESAGFPVINYAYYDAPTHGVNFSGMLSSLNELSTQSIVVLHACCHNPTGIDLSIEQWMKVIDLCKARQLIPFLDMAYQGFAKDIKTDATVVRLFANSGLSLLISNSFSKSFSLYGERVGALSIVTKSSDEAARVLSQVKRVIRTNYSNPPTHGGAIVSTILTSPELRALWEEELGEMRLRIQLMRQELVLKLNPLSTTLDFSASTAIPTTTSCDLFAGSSSDTDDRLRGQAAERRLVGTAVKADFSFINHQQGMFSYSGLTSEQAERLKVEHGVYILPTGRICIAALNTRNINLVVKAIKEVLS